MDKPVSPATKVERSWCRGKLLAALEKEEIITSITLGENSQFILHTTTWDDYWRGIQESSRDASELTENLHASWSRYIRAGFEPNLRREYCYCYFCLLHFILKDSLVNPDEKNLQKVICKVVGFENFGIKAFGSCDVSYAAATSALRNPCYLLTKLQKPEALIEDCQSLPVITLHSSQGPAELFFHYRQHRLSADSGNYLLLYISASKDKRESSFRVMNTLEHLISRGVDPRAYGHAIRIANRVVIPYLESQIDSSGPERIGNSFEIIDVGAGRGMLGAKVCDEVNRYFSSRGMEPSIRVHMVDLSISDPSRFFLGRSLMHSIDSISSHGADYRYFFSKERTSPEIRGTRIGLLARTLDSFINFKIISYNVAGFPGLIGEDGSRNISSWLPHNLLRPDGHSTGGLKVSSKKVPYESGSIYAQASLTEYYQAIDALLYGNDRLNQEGFDSSDTIFLPFRHLSSDSLFCDDGGSLIERIAGSCSILIILDSDLTPKVLRDHLSQIGSSLKTFDMMKAIGLMSYHCYVLAHESESFFTRIGGEKVWSR